MGERDLLQEIDRIVSTSWKDTRGGYHVTVDDDSVFAICKRVSAYLSALSPVVAAPVEADDLVARLREEADYLDRQGNFTGPLSTITSLRDAADRIDTQEREKRLLAGNLSMAERDLATLTAALDGWKAIAIGHKARISELEAALRKLEAVCPETYGCGLHCQSEHGASDDAELADALKNARALSKSEPVKQ